MIASSEPGRGRLAAVRALGRRRGPRVHLALLGLGAALAAVAPLADHLGYEFAEWLALLSGSAGLASGVAAARLAMGLESQTATSGSLPPPGAHSAGAQKPTPLAALGAALLWNASALLLPIAIILLNGLRRPVCDPLAGLLLVFLLPLPTALLAAAIGFAAAALAPRRAWLLCTLAFKAALAQALWPILLGPQVFAFDHLGGMYPGPIYDEAIGATPALWAFRACTLAWTIAAAGLGLFVLARRTQRTEGDRPAPSPPDPAGRQQRVGAHRLALGLLVVGLVPAAALSLLAERLHWEASVAQLDAELGGRLEGERVVLHFPREKAEAEQKRLLVDAEASAVEVLEFLGWPGAKPARVDVFLFRSSDEKRRLIGAADTSFTKPWLRQVHTNDAPAPHPVVRHELAHALGADATRAIFGVPGRLFGLLPDMAFIEGFAVAADWPAGEATVDQETAALRKLGKLPDLAQLFATGRFYGEAGPSAYTTAGSLIRLLWRTRGPDAVRAAYGAPEGLRALGPIEELAREHAAFLDSITVPESVLALAALRFSQPAILRKRCAHEVAELQRTAGRAAQRGDSRAAAQLWRQCAALEPDDPGILLAERRALAQAGDAVGAARAEAAALAHPKLSPPQRAQLLTELGDADWKRGDASGADAHYAQAAALPQTEGQRRALQARRYTLAEPARWPAVRRLLADGDSGPETWLLLRDLDLARPGEGLAAYLLAKQAQNQSAWETCLRFVAEASKRPLPGPLFEVETRRMQAACAARSGDAAAARNVLEALLRDPSEARRLEAARALRRL